MARSSNKRKRYASTAAGAAIGYIAGGSTGAAIGGSIGDYFGRSKPYTQSGGKRQKVAHVGRAGGYVKKRKGSWRRRRRVTPRRFTKGRRSRMITIQSGEHRMTSSSFKQKYFSKVPKFFRRIAGQRRLTWNGGMHASSSIGQQAVFYPLLYTSPTNGRIHWLLSSHMMVDMRDHVNLDENLVSGMSISNAQMTTKWWVDFVKVTVRMKSETVGLPVTVDWYDCYPRRDFPATGAAPKDPMDDWHTGMQDMSTGTNASFPTALPSSSTAGGSSFTNWYQVPGTTPMQSPRFQKNWKIARRTRIVLQPGEEHIHTIFLSPKYPFTTEQFSQNSTAWKGISYLPMVVMSAGMARDKTTTNMTLGQAVVDFMISGTCKFSAIGKNRTLWSNTGFFETVKGSNLVTVDPETDQEMVVDPQPEV